MSLSYKKFLWKHKFSTFFEFWGENDDDALIYNVTRTVRMAKEKGKHRIPAILDALTHHHSVT